MADESCEPNAIEEARRARQASGMPLLDLTDGNPTHCGYLFPPEVLQRSASAYLSRRSYDPDPHGLPEARRAICAYYAARTPALELTEDQIFITASTSEAYRLIFSLLCDPGDNLLAPQVTYPLFDLFAEDKAIELRSYTLAEEGGWHIAGQSLVHAKNRRTRGVLLVSPHNPTGMIHRVRDENLARLGLPLIADEVFAEFTHDGRPCPPAGALYPELPVFHLNGVSKMFALPDLKIGWIALNAAAARRFGPRLEILNDAFLSASSLGQAMLPAIFENGRAFTRAMIADTSEKVRSAVAQLSASERFELRCPEGGAFVFPAVHGDVDEEQLVLELINRGVFVHPGYFYGCSHGRHLMISCLVPRTRLEEGLQVLCAAE